MPAPASDAIASDIGHGALGVRYGLRPFRDLLSETAGQRHLWVELRPKKVLATWTSAGSGIYTKTITETFNGVALDVVGVRTISETLTRVGHPSDCGVAGTFYYDGTTLTIHLTADANPSGTTVVAEIGIHVGSHGVYQPLFMPDEVVDGGFEQWTESSPTRWSVATGGSGHSLDKTATDPLGGTYAARVTFGGAAAYKTLYQSVETVAGALYRVSGAYRIGGQDGSSLHARFYVYALDGGVDVFHLADGRTTTSVETPFLDATGDGTGEWRRFSFDFVAKVTAAASLWCRGQADAALTGTVDFDDVKFQCISRFAYFEPLLALDSLPTLEAARADSFWGQMSSSIGGLSLLNGSGYLEALLATYDWPGAAVIVRVGGRFQLGGNEILLDDCPVIATAKLQPQTVTDSRVTFDLEDDRSILLQTLPTRTYNNNGTDAYTQPDRGRSRPLLFGDKHGIRPVQYDIAYPYAGPVPMGKYEIVDCGDWTRGLVELTTLHWYTDEEAATARSPDRRVSVVMASDYSEYVTMDLATGRFDVLRDLRPLVITNENNKVYFDVGGATLCATVTPGTYPLADKLHISGRYGLLPAIETAMNAAAGTADIGTAFTDSTQKVRIAKTAGTLNLRCATGSDVQNGIWSLLGFNANADKTGALAYDADTVYTSAAYDQVIRADCWGFRDDASFTYTAGDNPIQYPAEIAWFLLREVLKVPASAIDTASFIVARTAERTAPFRPCSLYLGTPRTVADIFEELETTGNFDLVLLGGKWYCLLRDNTVPAGTPDLTDSDYLAFEQGYNPDDIYGTVTLTYNESPDGGDPINIAGNPWWWRTGRTEMGEVTDSAVVLRFARPHQRAFRTCLRDMDDAAYPLAGSRLEEVAAECSTQRRRFRITTKGKALQVPVNGKLRLTRTRGLDTTGALSNVLVRVISKRDDWARWVSEIEAIEIL